MEFENIKSSTNSKEKISKRFGNAVVDIDLKCDAKLAEKHYNNGCFISIAENSHYYNDYLKSINSGNADTAVDNSSNHYFLHKLNPDISESEIESYLQLKQIEEIQNQNEMISTIKKIAIFFAICGVISLITGIVIGISILGK